MKKLLTLLLLSPLATLNANDEYWSGTLDLENLGQFFINDSYVGLLCERHEDGRMGDSKYEIAVVSVEEKRGINLMFHSIEPNDEYIGSSLKKNDIWQKTYISDLWIEIDGLGVINRETLILNTSTQCQITDQEVVKASAYQLAESQEELEKERMNLYQERLKKRKL